MNTMAFVQRWNKRFIASSLCAVMGAHIATAQDNRVAQPELEGAPKPGEVAKHDSTLSILEEVRAAGALRSNYKNRKPAPPKPDRRNLIWVLSKLRSSPF